MTLGPSFGLLGAWDCRECEPELRFLNSLPSDRGALGDKIHPMRISRISALTLSCCCVVLLAVDALSQERRRSRRQPVRDTDNIKHFQIESKLLTDFWGRPTRMDAGVVLPPNHQKSEKLPVCYSIHGFGGSHTSAWRSGARLLEGMTADTTPRMIYVFLSAKCPLGHHVFADSVNNGPVGTALVEELIPALEAKFGAYGKPHGRFLTGHSSGGWSSLWVQVRHPRFFNGVWSTAPDSVDFRDFTGINVYDWKNAYVDPKGDEIQLMRRNGKFVVSFKSFTQREHSRKKYGGQIASFDAVFSPRGEDGQPQPMFDRETGAIDKAVAASWVKYDITQVVKTNWKDLREPLKNKVHVYMGTIDTFRLEGALYLFAADMKTLGTDFDIVFAAGRDHGSLFQPHETLWPKGMLTRIHREMFERFEQGK